MSRTDMERQLTDFASALIEDSGGLVDWDPDYSCGTAMVSLKLAESLGQHEETFSLGTGQLENGLSLSLGGEFVDMAARTLRHFVPSSGIFCVKDLPVKKTEFAAAVETAFGWQNARSKVLQGSAMTVPYHAWWFLATIQSEEAWESVIPLTINARTLASLPLAGLLELDNLRAGSAEDAAPDCTLETAAQIAEVQAINQASAFLKRIDTRHERDQKRLHEYYRALQREASTVNRRTKTTPTAEETAASVRAVKLELQRKLTELDERYQCTATLRPVAFAEFQIPAVGVDVEIQRKAEKRVFRVYWNSLLRNMEPLTCSRCHVAGWNFWFTNDTVAPLCAACHESFR